MFFLGRLTWINVPFQKKGPASKTRKQAKSCLIHVTRAAWRNKFGGFPHTLHSCQGWICEILGFHDIFDGGRRHALTKRSEYMTLEFCHAIVLGYYHRNCWPVQPDNNNNSNMTIISAARNVGTGSKEAFQWCRVLWWWEMGAAFEMYLEGEPHPMTGSANVMADLIQMVWRNWLAISPLDSVGRTASSVKTATRQIQYYLKRSLETTSTTLCEMLSRLWSQSIKFNKRIMGQRQHMFWMNCVVVKNVAH